MLVNIRLFALAKQRVGKPSVEVELPEGATVADLRRLLARNLPELEALALGAMVAVDSAYASDEVPLTPDSEVALIPPVSGGGGHATRLRPSPSTDSRRDP